MLRFRLITLLSSLSLPGVPKCRVRDVDLQLQPASASGLFVNMNSGSRHWLPVRANEVQPKSVPGLVITLQLFGIGYAAGSVGHGF